MAHAQLGFRQSQLGESSLARQSLLKAYQLRDRASDAERFFIDTLYDRDVTGNLERERQTLESWAETYPRDAGPTSLLAGFATTSIGEYELAIDKTGKAIDAGFRWRRDADLRQQGRHQLHLNRLDDALPPSVERWSASSNRRACSWSSTSSRSCG